MSQTMKGSIESIKECKLTHVHSTVSQTALVCLQPRFVSRGSALKQHNIAIVWLRHPITGSLVQQHLTKPDAEIIKQSITLNKRCQ